MMHPAGYRHQYLLLLPLLLALLPLVLCDGGAQGGQ
jgi:hypothetical protein